MRVEQGDMREVLAREAVTADSFDACVCDPPYDLTQASRKGSPRHNDGRRDSPYKRHRAGDARGFMGKTWDATGVAFDPATWRKVFRVLKPGAHLVAFGGTRTHHRLMCAVEDAGFEIRDCGMLIWAYGSGFPKSHDVSKAIDKKRHDDIRPVCRFLRSRIESASVSVAQLAKLFGFNKRMIEHWAARDTDSQPTCPTWDQWIRLKKIVGFGDSIDQIVQRLNQRKGKPSDTWNNADIIGEYPELKSGLPGVAMTSRDNLIRRPATPEAAAWQGWGTALKPAWEPIVLARKPLSERSVAANVLRWGTGAINVGACRIGTTQVERDWMEATARPNQETSGWGEMRAPAGFHADPAGRWPANLVLAHDPRCVLVGTEAEHGYAINRYHSKAKSFGSRPFGGGNDGSGQYDSEHVEGGERELWACVPGCPARMLDEQSGPSISPPVGSVARVKKHNGFEGKSFAIRARVSPNGKGDSGGASRFFYTAKASTDERVLGCPPGFRNRHPTVKPLALMRWLVRLVAPPGGVVLDPFAGSGSTLVAAHLEGHDALGIDLDPESVACARGRIAAAERYGASLTGLKRVRVKRRRFKRGK